MQNWNYFVAAKTLECAIEIPFYIVQLRTISKANLKRVSAQKVYIYALTNIVFQFEHKQKYRYFSWFFKITYCKAIVIHSSHMCFGTFLYANLRSSKLQSNQCRYRLIRNHRSSFTQYSSLLLCYLFRLYFINSTIAIAFTYLRRNFMYDISRTSHIISRTLWTAFSRFRRVLLPRSLQSSLLFFYSIL